MDIISFSTFFLVEYPVSIGNAMSWKHNGFLMSFHVGFHVSSVNDISVKPGSDSVSH